MKKVVIAITLILFALIGIRTGTHYSNAVKNAYTPPLPTLKPIGIPVTLDIPAIGVHTQVESVGLDKDNLMDVPKDDKNAAWYNLGAKPGEKGNAVIDGHVDTPTGAPAVFAKLKELKQGDKIIVTDKDGMQHKFVVTEIKKFSTKLFPVNLAFGPSSDSNLNLITCDGAWDSNAKNYSERLVVFSKLMK